MPQSLRYTMIGVFGVYIGVIIHAGFIKANGGDSLDPTPSKYTEIDGCTVYKFFDERGANYFATCPNSNSAVTSATGEHIPTVEEIPATGLM